MIPKLSTLGALAAALYSSGACAADVGGAEVTLGAFGTFGLVHSSESQADFTSSITKPTGAGYSHEWSSDVDSIIGAQLTADFTPKLSAVVQVISRQNSDNTYKPDVEWANVKFQVTDDFSARIGRTIMPYLLFSDARNVAYAIPWVRLPSVVYSLSPLTRSDGLDLSYRHHVGEWTNTLEGLVGRQDINLPGATAVRARDIAVISATSERGPLSVRAVYQQARVSTDAFNPLFDAFTQFGPPGILIADTYDVSDKHFSSFGAGASYEAGHWMAVAEWTRVTTHSLFGRSTGWYASGGYRFGNFTPYAIVAQARSDNLSDPGLNTAGLPPYLVEAATGLNAALNSILRTKNVSNTVSAGGRWDVFTNVDLKLQYGRTRIDAGSTGGLVDIQPGFQTGGTYHLISATVDFVY
ncbi:MAG: hypothetical protein ACYDAH_17675 [Steroidobacteraceae bacterium]